MMRPLSALMAAALGACTLDFHWARNLESEQAEAIESSTSVDAEPPAVHQAIADELQRLGFELDATDANEVRAHLAGEPDERFSNCNRVRISSSTGRDSRRYRSVPASAERIVVTAYISKSDAATVVTLQRSYVGTYHNSFTGRSFERNCQTNGKLERAIIDTVEQLAPVPGSEGSG